MLSCFKGENSTLWENRVETNHTAVYTSTSGFSEENVPKISAIIESVKRYDVFKYAAYRTAFKLHTIRKASKLHRVDLMTVNTILNDYELENSSLDETITLAKAHSLMSVLYTEAGKKYGFSDEPNQMAFLFVAFLQNTFVENEEPILFFHLKTALTLFSSAKLSEKFKYLFHCCSNGNILTKENLSILLTSLSKFPNLVGEQVTFGSHLVPKSIKHLLKFSKGKVTLKNFQKWLVLEPQTLVWISTLHRIAASETTHHSITCDYCHIHPVVGFRYRCIQCINYNLCQNCFLHGCVNKGHKEKHPVQEFCHPATKWEEAKAVINAVRNNISFVRCPSKAYLSFDEESINDSIKDKSNHPSNSPVLNCSLRKSTASYVVKELAVIISQLESEKRNQFSMPESCKENIPKNEQVKNGSQREENEKSDSCHQSTLDLILERLKNLLQSLETNDISKENTGLSPVPHVPFNKMDHYFESTPLSSGIPLYEPKLALNHLSNSNINYSQNTTEKQRNYSTSLDFTPVFQSPSSGNFTNSDVLKSSSSMTCPSPMQSTGISLDLGSSLNNTSSLNYSEKIAPLSESKLSPLFLSSFNSYGESLNDCNYSVTPIKKSLSTPSVKNSISSTFILKPSKSLEDLEMELQSMLQHIEELLPQMSGLSTSTQGYKGKIINTLSDMEVSVKKLSHLSIALSTGSTEL